MRPALALLLLLCAVPATAQVTPAWLAAERVAANAMAVALPSESAQSDAPTWDKKANVLAISYLALASADIGMTSACSAARRCKELNPLLSPLVNGGHYGWAGAAKMTITTGTVWAIYRYTRPHSRTRYLAFAVMIATQAAIVGFNSSQHVMDPR